MRHTKVNKIINIKPDFPASPLEIGVMPKIGDKIVLGELAGTILEIKDGIYKVQINSSVGVK